MKMIRFLILAALASLPLIASADTTRYILYSTHSVIDCSLFAGGGKLTMDGADVYCADDNGSSSLSLSSAAVTYLHISSTPWSAGYLSNSSATATYLSLSSAAVAYLGIASAPWASGYLSYSSAAVSYLGISSTPWASGYLSNSSATATYVNYSSAAVSYLGISSTPWSTGYLANSSATATYVSYSSAAVSYLGISSTPWNSGVQTNNSTTTYTGTETFNGMFWVKGSTGSAPSGYRNNYISSATSCSTPFAVSNGVWADLGSVTLSPGVWDLEALAIFKSVSLTGSSAVAGIGTAPGNDGSGLVLGQNYTSSNPPTNSYDKGATIPRWRTVITSQTTYYLKVQVGVISGGCNVCGSITAEQK